MSFEKWWKKNGYIFDDNRDIENSAHVLWNAAIDTALNKTPLKYKEQQAEIERLKELLKSQVEHSASKHTMYTIELDKNDQLNKEIERLRGELKSKEDKISTLTGKLMSNKFIIEELKQELAKCKEKK